MNCRYRINPERSAWRIVDGEAVLIHAETTYYYGLNGSATDIWRLLLEADLSASQIAEQLTSQLDFEPEVIQPQIGSFLEELRGEGLLDAIDSNGGPPSPLSTLSSTAHSGSWMAPEVVRYDSLEDLIVCGE